MERANFAARLYKAQQRKPSTNRGLAIGIGADGQHTFPVIVIAHISDIHIDGDERSAERARRIVRYLTALRTPVDVV